MNQTEQEKIEEKEVAQIREESSPKEQGGRSPVCKGTYAESRS